MCSFGTLNVPYYLRKKRLREKERERREKKRERMRGRGKGKRGKGKELRIYEFLNCYNSEYIRCEAYLCVS